MYQSLDHPERFEPAVVTYGDDDETPRYPAVVDRSQRWNGWAVPHFTRATVERIMAHLDELDDPTADRFSWDGDILRMTYGPDAYAPGISGEELAPVTIGDELYWAVGGHSWTWSVVDSYALVPVDDGRYQVQWTGRRDSRAVRTFDSRPEAEAFIARLTDV